MPEFPKILSDVSAQEPTVDIRRFVSAGALGALAIATLELRRRGMIHEMPAGDISGPVIDSTAHPILGYAGAWLGVQCARMRSSVNHAGMMIAGGTAINFMGESVQSLVRSTPETVNYLSAQNLPETTKDYTFALLGAGLFMYQYRKSKEPSTL